ncbi:PQQ-binding-like beta-propeller repeat protein [Streptomyces sp. DH12]|uniref:PQQ-binding-like beta-propeller repeat protein n=1 Tax=Streptomyces sp. DH12 TaxID=2857010 RepID=UPI001E2B16D4|nr:PQQ-binding-like beta-propeller repeat protein [Streptomyces sp. DH12]
MATRRAFLAGSTAVVSTALLPPTPEAHAEAGSQLMRDPQLIGIPLSDVLLLGGTVAPGPTGKQALWGASTGKPARLNALDPTTGDLLVSVSLTGGDGAWAVTEAPSGVYAGTYGNAHLYRWSPDSGEIAEDLGLPAPGQTFIWALATDSAGKVWGGTFPGGKVFRFDPATRAFTDFGQAVPGQTYVRSIACSGGKVYSGSYAAAHIAELDPATGTFTQLPTPPGLDTIAGKPVYDLDAYDGRLYARIGSDAPNPLYVFDLATRTWSAPIPEVHGLSVCPPGEDGAVYFIQRGELRRYDPATGENTGTGLRFSGKVQNARSFGWAELGLPDYPGRSVVGTLWRGDMFRYNPATGAHAVLGTKVRKEPIDIQALEAGGRRTLYAGGFLNGGFSAVNTLTGAPTFHRFGQIEAILRDADGTVWIGQYPDARLFRYHPAKPWNSPEYSPEGPPGTPPNPEVVLTLKPELQSRARCLADVGTKVAVGTVPDGNRLGGGLALYDKETGDWTFTRNVVRDMSIISLDAEYGVVYGGASIFGGLGTTPPTRTAGAVFAWHVERGEKLWERELVQGIGAVSAVAVAGGAVWALTGHSLFALNPGTGEVIRRLELGTRNNDGSIVISRRKLYVSVDGALIFRVDPLFPNRDPQLLVNFPHRRLAAHEGFLYFSRGPELYTVDVRR